MNFQMTKLKKSSLNQRRAPWRAFKLLNANWAHYFSSYTNISINSTKMGLLTIKFSFSLKSNSIKCTTAWTDLMLRNLQTSSSPSTLEYRWKWRKVLCKHCKPVVAMNLYLSNYSSRLIHFSFWSCISTWTGLTKSYTQFSLLKTKINSMRICLLTLKKAGMSQLRRVSTTSRKNQQMNRTKNQLV